MICTVGIDVLGELPRGEHRVAVVGRDERVRHRADARGPPPARLRIRRNADRAGDVRGISVSGLHEPVIVARRKEHDRLRMRGVDHEPRVRAHARAPREHAEVEGLEMGEHLVRAFDRHHRFPGLDRLAVVERAHRERAPVIGAELEDRDRLIHAAQIRLRLSEHLHRDARGAMIGEQDLAGANEILVGVVAFPHSLDGKMKDGRIEPGATRRWHRHEAIRDRSLAATVATGVF